MAWTTPRTWVASELVTASIMNVHVRDNINYLYDLRPIPSTWTPTLTGSGGSSGQAYSSQVGHYIKTGQLVVAHGRIVVSTLGTLTTSVRIGGLPATSDSSTNFYGTCHIGSWSNTNDNFVSMSGLIPPNAAYVDLYGAGAAATSVSAIVQTNFTSSTILSFTCVYRSAS